MANEWMITADDLLGATAPVNAPRQESRPTISFDEIVSPQSQGEWTEGGTGAWDAPRTGSWGPPVRTPQDSRAFPVFKSNLVEDPETKVRLAAQSLFPGDPNGVNRLGIIGGRLVKVADDGQLEYVADKWGEFGAGVAANIPEIVAGTVGSLTASPVLGSTLGVMGARGLKRAGAGLLFDEPQTVGGNLMDIGKEGAINAVTASVGKGIATAANRGRVVDFTPANMAEAKAVQAQVKGRFGIDLNLAQASQDPRLLQMWRYLARYPGKSAEIADVAQTLQEGQVDAAVTKFLDLAGKGYPSAILGKGAVDISKQTIAQARKKLSDEVRPLYDAAYESVGNISDPKVAAIVSRPFGKTALEKARKLASSEGYDYADGAMDLRLLDYTKRALDDMAESAASAGNRNEARIIRGQRDELVKFLDGVSDAKYKTARDAYAAGMKSTVEPLEKGVVGILAGIKDERVASAAVRVFRDPNVGPREILQAKGAILAQPGGKEAWDGLVRQWLGRSWDAANRVTQKGDIVNPAGKFVQNVAGTPSQTATLKAALGAERGETAAELIDTLRRVASTRVDGSDTAFNQEITRMFGGPMARFLRAISQPVETIRSEADRKAVQDMTTRIAEALTDTSKTAQLRTALRMPDSTRKWFVISAVLFGEGAQAAAADPTENRMPPLATQQPQR